ncbi:MAG: protein-L-isoaspartate(D-aspartate) O-methyltransferase [Tissierellales bacterium]|nr:protein-L-isoaspartate(D-aspartate) O-methyltransferase [Tissierellales bacterium]MBN2827794.1 protein-L-isoaspartate(D-aspartate) O-methyltransferase [Tissierellales bacterium]
MNTNDKIKKYFYKLDRRLFLDAYKESSEIDLPLPIGYGQTISQPSLVLDMTLMLMPEPHLRTLEIGTGSGYQTAILSEFSKEVFTIERISQLYEKAKIRLDGLGYQNIYYKLDDGTMGWKSFAPFDRIMVTAAARFIPPALTDQLAVNGRMVIPVGGSSGQELLLVTKAADGVINTEIKGYVQFVPLIGKYETP